MHYGFRYGVGNDQALAATKAIDGSVAMISSEPPAPASALPAAKDDATRDAEGVVQPSKIREPISDYEFRHGLGSLDGEAPMAMNRAIDGSYAMISIDAPPAPRNALPVAEAPASIAPAAEVPATEAPVAEAPVASAPATDTLVAEAPAAEAPPSEAPAAEAPVAEAPVAETTAAPVKGVVRPSGARRGPVPDPYDADEFRHGLGERALSMFPAIDGTAAMISPQ